MCIRDRRWSACAPRRPRNTRTSRSAVAAMPLHPRVPPASRSGLERILEAPWGGAVSYTHLTLPTILLV
eukprot:4190911-Pyramimonas_sp.AAC.1